MASPVLGNLLSIPLPAMALERQKSSKRNLKPSDRWDIWGEWGRDLPRLERHGSWFLKRSLEATMHDQSALGAFQIHRCPNFLRGTLIHENKAPETKEFIRRKKTLVTYF